MKILNVLLVLILITGCNSTPTKQDIEIAQSYKSIDDKATIYILNPLRSGFGAHATISRKEGEFTYPSKGTRLNATLNNQTYIRIEISDGEYYVDAIRGVSIYELASSPDLKVKHLEKGKVYYYTFNSEAGIGLIGSIHYLDEIEEKEAKNMIDKRNLKLASSSLSIEKDDE